MPNKNTDKWPSIKDHKPAKSIKVKHDKYMNVLAPTLAKAFDSNFRKST